MCVRKHALWPLIGLSLRDGSNGDGSNEGPQHMFFAAKYEVFRNCPQNPALSGARVMLNTHS